MYLVKELLQYWLMIAIKGKFYKIYANIPLNLREEIVLVINEEPITWKIAKLEIDNDTKLSEKILGKLEALKLI